MGSTLLDRASERLGAYHGLPAVVQGAVLTAVGSSFPELSSVLLATLLHDSFDLGVGAIVGSAIFNVLVIPAASALSTDERVEASRDLVYKEALFYLLSISVLLVVFALAVIYNPRGGELVGSISRPLAAIPIAVYGLYLFIQLADARDREPTRDASGIDPRLEWGLLAVSLALIVLGVEGVVRAAIGMGELFDTPSFVWGLTIVAAATSLPDAFVSIQAAKREAAQVSLANVLGSNVFDLLVAVPLGVIVAGSATIDFAAAVPMMGVLTLATLVLFAFLRTDMELSDAEAVGLLVAYGGFVVFVLETAGLVNLVG